MPYSTAAKNLMLAQLATFVGKLSAHTGNPGTAGTANECTGGSPAYARKNSPGFNTPSGSAMSLTAPVTFDIVSQTVAWVGMWTTDGATFLGAGQLPVPQVVSGQGTVVVSDFRPKLVDPA